jgi:hypothetical protein
MRVCAPSPVIMASLMNDDPSSTSPSAGMREPGRTWMCGWDLFWGGG